MKQDFKNLYVTEVIPYFKEVFKYTNLQQIPKLEKIQINRGLGKAGQNTKILKNSIVWFKFDFCAVATGYRGFWIVRF